MPRLTAPDVPADLAAGLDAIREELDVPGEFPADALREAEEAARAPLAGRVGERFSATVIDQMGEDPVRRHVRFAPA